MHMIKSKAYFHFKQYLPLKRVKWGLKEFALCDSRTAILVNFDLYTEQAAADDVGLTHAVVHHLLEGLDNQNYIVVTDKYYSSTVLANSLQERGVHLLGTLRMNRQGIPD